MSIQDFLGTEKVQSLLRGDFDDDLVNIFNKVSLETQLNKAKGHGIDLYKRMDILNSLKVRPMILAELAKFFNVKNIAEVGTAQGLQSITFASILSDEPESKVYTCDPVDVRSEIFSNYKNLEFINGTSVNMRDKIKSDNKKIDLFWIDGAHDHYSVVGDVLTLIQCSHKDSLWVFDDFDKRFGCYYDIQLILNASVDNIILNLGKTASDNPNIIAIARGLL